MTLADVGSTAQGLSKRLSDLLKLSDSLGDSLIFALQASLTSLAALWLAMWLQLDSPYWAASTVLITAQATRPQSLLKAFNRVLGTTIGIVASLVIVALFPQHWWSFAVALSGWLALCTFVSCLLRALQSYAAALSGYTAIIVLTESFGDPNGAFATALSRGSTVVLGVALYSLTALLLIPARSSEDLRDAFEDMFAKVRHVAAGVLRGQAGAEDCAKLMARFPDFDQQIEEAATDGLWPPGAKEGMRRATLGMADMLMLSYDAGQGEIASDDGVRARAAAELDQTTGSHPVDASVARLDRESAALHGEAPDRRAISASLAAMAQVRAGLALLRTGVTPAALGHVRRTVHRDYVAAAYGALRAFIGTLGAFAFWIETRWSSGDSFVLIVGILCCLFASRPAPVSAGLRFTVGTAITTVLALVLGFFVIPRLGSFLGLALALFPTMLIGSFGLKSKVLAPFCTPVNFFLVSMIGIQNQMQYDPPTFFNSTFAIFCGCCTGVVIFTLLPPPSDAVQAAILRWWIGLETVSKPPRSARRREEWRLRLYDRLGLLIAKLPEKEQATAFEDSRPAAMRLQAAAVETRR